MLAREATDDNAVDNHQRRDDEKWQWMSWYSNREGDGGKVASSNGMAWRRGCDGWSDVMSGIDSTNHITVFSTSQQST